MLQRVRRLAVLMMAAAVGGCALLVGIGDLSDAPRERDGGSGSGEAGPEAGGGDAAVEPPSCALAGPGRTNCGVGGGESCCKSPLVLGGSFFRGYDGVTSTDQSAPATVSSFRLDRDKVTVGRFRAFVGEVVTAGWRPAAGSGRHVHLGGGSGLTGSDGKSETGWDPAWNASLPATLADWTQRLSCDPRNVYTWTETAGEKENRPITCVDWLSAYAFCIWDGAFLPTVTESTYAAAGGGGATGQRVYPWSVPPASGVIDCAHANYGDGDAGVCAPPGIHDVGKTSPAGDGAFGQSDLVGNTWDWQFDYAGGEFTNPCQDCATTTPGDGGSASVRGVSFRFRANDLRVVAAYGLFSGVADDLGLRCARIP